MNIRLLLILSVALLASAASADELRVRDADTLTVYSGELTSINPVQHGPNEIRFNADQVTIFPIVQTPAFSKPAPNVQPWIVYLSIDSGPVTLQCAGNVPAYLGDTFAQDLTDCHVL
jgi:hypothetical protein